MKYYFKELRRIDNKLVSVTKIFPVEYRINKWIIAPKDTGLFVYKEYPIFPNSYDSEIWLCECKDPMELPKRDFFLEYKQITLSDIQLLWNDTYHKTRTPMIKWANNILAFRRIKLIRPYKEQK